MAIRSVDLATQGINDPHHVFQPHGRFACLEFHNEAHADPSREGQIGLRQAELLASRTQCIAEFLR